MFSFFKKREERKAFQRALAEVDQEISASSELKNNVIERTYKTSPVVQKIDGVSKFKNAINKPETSAVDLKHFKDWRTISGVQPKKPSYIPPIKDFRFEEDDDGDEPQRDMPGAYSKKDARASSSINLIASINESKDAVKEKDTSINSFFAEKYKTNDKKESDVKAEPKPAVSKPEPTVSKLEPVNSKPEPRKKSNLNSILSKSLSNVQEHKKPEFKVEVIDFAEKEKPKKKVVNRKPRGKNKRRFDADVISAVDWK